MTTLAERFRFFHEHAGYIVGQRAVCAMRLARAEARASELGLSIEWEDEHEPWDGDCPAPRYHMMAAVIHDEKYLASLGGIGLNSWGDPYVRVVKAKLFAEALDEIDAESERRACNEAEALAARATYAG